MILEYNTRRYDITKLFNRVPDDIVLAVSSVEIEPHDGDTCLVAWLVRADFARLAKIPVEDSNTLWDSAPGTAAEHFGGSRLAWSAVYNGIMEDGGPGSPYERIEAAWAQRTLKAASRR